jgi:hypothetical protein
MTSTPSGQRSTVAEAIDEHALADRQHGVELAGGGRLTDRTGWAPSNLLGEMRPRREATCPGWDDASILLP